MSSWYVEEIEKWHNAAVVWRNKFLASEREAIEETKDTIESYKLIGEGFVKIKADWKLKLEVAEAEAELAKGELKIIKTKILMHQARMQHAIVTPTASGINKLLWEDMDG